MNKALNLTISTLLAMGFAAKVSAHMDSTLARHSSLSVTGTYTNTSNNTLSMGEYVFPGQIFHPIQEHRAIFINTDFQFDYALGYTFHFPCTHTRFFVTYDHYNSDDENESVGHVTNIAIFPNTGVFSGPTKAFGRVHQHAQEFRLGFSHFLEFGPRYALDVEAFFAWDKVQRELHERANYLQHIDRFAIRETSDEMAGWGPGVGAMGHMKPFRCLNWGLFMGAKATLLWVDNEFSQTHQYDNNTAPLIPSQASYFLRPEESESMVTKLDIKFGVSYSNILRTDIGAMLVQFDLGMRYMNIFNAFKQGNTAYNSLFAGFIPNGLGASAYAANTGYAYDWGRMGPYLTFRIGGAHA